MMYSIAEKTLAPQPVLVLRRRIRLSDIGTAIRAALADIQRYGDRHGLTLADPFTRYVEIAAGEMIIEPGMRIVGAAPAHGAGPAPRPTVPADDGDIVHDTLPGGSVATTVHEGPYESLVEAHVAVQQWIESRGLRSIAPGWERYVAGPTNCSDPWQWQTEVFWPLG
jgi:hypothetical protein